MKKINATLIKEFIERHEIPFLATQPKLCIPIIVRLCQKMSHGIKFDEIKICDNLIIDGHHRYLSSLIMNFDIGMVATNKGTSTKLIEWRTVEFDENDWDTLSKISHLNKLDAIYNNLDIEFVNQMTV